MLGKLLLSFLISASPFGEMKVGLPYAILQGDINPWIALLFCMAGNLLVFPIVDYFMTNYGGFLLKNRMIKKGVVKLRSHAKSKTQALMQKYGFWGLMIFVMVPIPGTGAYLGTIAAYFLNIKRGRAFAAISAGVVLSGILLQAVTLGAFEIWSL